MQQDPELLAETRAWFLRAKDDLEAGVLDLEAKRPLTGDAAFHAQQVGEKAMKGFLTWHSRLFRKTHNLGELGGLCAEIDASLEPLLRRASLLTDFAWKFRYPGELEEPSPKEAEEALALAGQVYQALIERLPKEVRP